MTTTPITRPWDVRISWQDKTRELQVATAAEVGALFNRLVERIASTIGEAGVALAREYFDRDPLERRTFFCVASAQPSWSFTAQVTLDPTPWEPGMPLL